MLKKWIKRLSDEKMKGVLFQHLAFNIQHFLFQHSNFNIQHYQKAEHPPTHQQDPELPNSTGNPSFFREDEFRQMFPSKQPATYEKAHPQSEQAMQKGEGLDGSEREHDADRRKQQQIPQQFEDVGWKAFRLGLTGQITAHHLRATNHPAPDPEEGKT
jgi:hypothetical protein